MKGYQRRAGTGRSILIVALCWFSATFLIFMHIDDRVETGHKLSGPHHENLNIVFDRDSALQDRKYANRSELIHAMLDPLEVGPPRETVRSRQAQLDVKQVAQENKELLKIDNTDNGPGAAEEVPGVKPALRTDNGSAVKAVDEYGKIVVLEAQNGLRRHEDNGGVDIPGAIIPDKVAPKPGTGGDERRQDGNGVVIPDADNLNKVLPNMTDKVNTHAPYSNEDAMEVVYREFLAIPNLPDAVYQSMPPGAPGEMGQAFALDINKLSKAEKEEHDKGQREHAFNLYASDRISVRRAVPDIRLNGCPRNFRFDLPPTSVIICFHNEAWSVLLRTVHSVLDRSPPHLLMEIILIDDCSTMDHLKDSLEYYMQTLGKVRIIRLLKRQGLIRARLTGYTAARAPVLTFLDSHVECYPGWLEPLLDAVAENQSTVITPVINMISASSLSMGGGQLTSVGNFKLTDPSFNWMSIPAREKKRRKHDWEPVRSPTMAGGLFSISKAYFEHIGTYDEGMDIWGYENVEISLRIWMCGGSLLISPCSHVGHIFRSRSPYSWGRSARDILKKNSVRLAEVWLDEYKKYYYERINYNLGEYGDVSARKELRERLQCKSFQWYIDNVYPEIEIPPAALMSGELKVKVNRALCLDSMGNHGPAKMGSCHKMGWNQNWMLTNRNDLRVRDDCLYYSGRTKTFLMSRCMEGRAYQKWKRLEDGHLQSEESGRCLTYSPVQGLTMEACAPTAEQIWDFRHTNPS